MIERYHKFFVAALGAVAVILTTVFPDNPPQWVLILETVLTALGVYAVPNDQPSPPTQG